MAELKLAFRREGKWWVARLGHEGPKVAQIAMQVIEDEARRKAFMDLLSSYMSDLIETTLGVKPERMEVRPAPESERSGNA